MSPDTVFHYSDDPLIPFFEPHRAATAVVDGEWVWAVDEHRAPCYWFPRDCPRATFWAHDDGRTVSLDADQLLAGADRVHAIQWDWFDEFSDAELYVYAMPGESFIRTEDAFGPNSHGFWVSRETIAPLHVRKVGDLLAKHANAGIELRLVKDLAALWQRVIVADGLDFSGIRLRNLRS